MSELSIIAIPMAIALVLLLLGFVGCSFTPGSAQPQPLGFWRLNEPGGPTAGDEASPPHNGTYSQSGVVYAQPDLQAAFTGMGPPSAARFDGTGYVEVQFDTALNPSSFSIDALAKVTALGGSQAVITSFDGSNTGYGIFANGSGTDQWELWLGDGSAQSFMSPAIKSSLNVSSLVGQIVVLSASYDANTQVATLIVTVESGPDSGQSDKQTNNVAYVPNPATNLRIAASSLDQPPAEFFSGALANVAIYPS
jgi:hypothetical protein